MANIQAASFRTATYSGEDGNSSVAHGVYTCASTATTTTIELVKLPAGVKIHGIDLVNAALGTSSTVSVGWKYTDGTSGGAATTFHNAVATATAGKTASACAPVSCADHEVSIYATIGGAAATGQIDVIVHYEFIGDL